MRHLKNLCKSNFAISRKRWLRGKYSWFNGLSDGLRNRSKRVSTSIAPLRSISGKYPWERYESPYPPHYGLNSTATVLLGEWLWH